MPNPPLLHLGDPIRWNHDLYARLSSRFDVRRSGGMPRAEFAAALRRGQFGEFVAVYRPFWSTGGEMGDWDEELMYVCGGRWMGGAEGGTMKLGKEAGKGN